jgi:hybrid cluster-associated redox disulfide protein
MATETPFDDRFRDDGPIELSSNLEATLAGRSGVVTLFLSRRMACPGCPMAVFETLADAARNHGMDGDELLAAVRQAAARGNGTAHGEEE